MTSDALDQRRTTSRGGARQLSAAEPVGFDFQAVADALGEPGDDGPRVNEDIVFATREILRWLLLGTGDQLNPQATAKRAVALAILLRLPAIEAQPVATLARDFFDSPPETLNRYVRALNKRFGLYSPGQKGRTHSRDRIPADPSRN